MISHYIVFDIFMQSPLYMVFWVVFWYWVPLYIWKLVYFWVCDILYVLFNILNIWIASERIVLKTTIHSLERDYIKKPCQHTDNIANYHTHAGIFSYQLSDKMKVAKIIIIQVTKKIYRNIVLLWYILIGGVVYILVIIPIFKIMVMCFTQT